MKIKIIIEAELVEGDTCQNCYFDEGRCPDKDCTDRHFEMISRTEEAIEE